MCVISNPLKVVCRNEHDFKTEINSFTERKLRDMPLGQTSHNS